MAKLDLEKRLAQLKAEAEQAPDDTHNPNTIPADAKPEPGAKKKSKKAPGKAVTKKAPAKKAPAGKRVTPEKASAFAHQYVISGCNATAAYKNAISPTCKDSTAQVQGHRWLSKPIVQQHLAPLLEALMEKNEVNAEWVLGRWKEQADCSPLDYLEEDCNGDIRMRSLESFTDVERRNLKAIRITKTVTRTEGDNFTNESTTYRWHITVQDQQKAVEMFGKYLQMFTRDLDEDEVERIGDLIEQGVKRIRANKNLDAWRTIDAEFSEVG